jgi:hypothetical protein
MIGEYLVHDNGGRPFCVKVTADSVNIFKEEDLAYTKLVLNIPTYEEVYYGTDPTGICDNNSILIRINPNLYVWCGYKLLQFKTKDMIESFITRMGNNDVPYPYAIGTDRTYLLLEEVFINNTSKVGDNSDPYQQYYGFLPGYDKRQNEDLYKKMRPKTIHKRIW